MMSIEGHENCFTPDNRSVTKHQKSKAEFEHERNNQHGN